jgi:L-amino acid N-acyltransferase YncA
MKSLDFEEVGLLTDITDLRIQYLDQLIEAQELYLELLVRSSKVFVIKSKNKRIGYFLLGDDGTLLEYYVSQDNIDQVDTLLPRIVEKYNIAKALCKSFDHTLLSSCIGIQKSVNVVGINFREYREKTPAVVYEDISIRPATVKDEQLIVGMNEEVFEQEEEVKAYIENKQILLFEKEKEVLGFGIFARVIEGRPEFDIGVLVDRKYRGRGYGEYIIRYLVNYCRQNGWRAICGCAIENEGSRRSLEKAGFIGRYRLLEFVF